MEHSDAAPAPSYRMRRSVLHAFARAALLALGVMAVVWLIHHVGTDAVQCGLLQVAPYLPVLLALEGCRIGCECIATRCLISELGASVPSGPLSRAVLVCYSLTIAAPAGRVAGEGVKAAMLAPHIGTPQAVAVATALQAVNLLAVGVMGLIAAPIAYASIGWSWLTLSLVGLGVTHCAAGYGIQLVARQRAAARWLSALVPRLRRWVVRFRASARRIQCIPRSATWVMIASRLLQVIQFGTMGYALNAQFGLEFAFVGEGVYLLSAAVGDLIPAQLGVIDGAFALTAADLGMTAASAAVVGLLVHCVQLGWVALGAVAPLLDRNWRWSSSASIG